MKTLIYVPVFNRRHVTKLALENLKKYKSESSKVVVYNDWSTTLDDSYIEPMCDEVVRLPPVSGMSVRKSEKNRLGRGVAFLRWHQFRAFLKQSEFDFLYMTDSDVIHDPVFESKLYQFHEEYKHDGRHLPVCLYNSRFHADESREVFKNEEVVIRKTIPGVSQFYSREMCERIVFALDALGAEPDYGWDYRAVNYLDGLGLMSVVSYVEHFGASEDSMHTKKGDWNRDRAQKPTFFLKNLWDTTIKQIELLSVKDEILSNKIMLDRLSGFSQSGDRLSSFINDYEPQFRKLSRLFVQFQDLVREKLAAVASQAAIDSLFVKSRFYQARQSPFEKILVYDLEVDRLKIVAIDITLSSSGYKIEIFPRDKLCEPDAFNEFLGDLEITGKFVGRKYLVDQIFSFDEDVAVGEFVRDLVLRIVEKQSRGSK